MNIVRELRKKSGIQQKELAIAIGVSCPTVSSWESNKKDPSGKHLKKLAEYFNVDELFILGYGLEKPNLFIPDSKSDISETEQIVQHVIEKLGIPQTPKTQEAKILAAGVDKLPKEQREQALNVVRAMFSQYSDFFERGEEN